MTARTELRADCANCFGLCCVALAFARSADFAMDKPAGDPCTNLDPHDRCRIHPRLRDVGMKGCTVFDCFGAGQKVSQHTFDGRSWRADPGTRADMFAVFPRMRRLHELLWYLTEGARLTPAGALRDELARRYEELEALTLGPARAILDANIDGIRATAAETLRAVSARVRRQPRGASPLPRPTAKLARRLRPGGDLLGAALSGTDLRGADLRGAYLIAAELSGCDLRHADLIGADLRDARLHGADVSEALFVTQLQLNAALGDARTRIPAGLERPPHWA